MPKTKYTVIGGSTRDWPKFERKGILNGYKRNIAVLQMPRAASEWHE
jgi:hypothetical protein